MIELNLLPQEFRKKKRKKIELPKLPIIPLAATIFGILVILQISLMAIIFLLKGQEGRLAKRWEELRPKKIELDKLKKEIGDINKQASAIDELMKERVLWARILNEISSSITPNIWLTSLSYEEKTEKKPVKEDAKKVRRASRKKTKASQAYETYQVGTLLVSGNAAGRGEEAPAYIARFINALKKNKNFAAQFQEIEPISMKKMKVAGEEVMDFTLSCTFKEEKG